MPTTGYTFLTERDRIVLPSLSSENVMSSREDTLASEMLANGIGDVRALPYSYAGKIGVAVANNDEHAIIAIGNILARNPYLTDSKVSAPAQNDNISKGDNVMRISEPFKGAASRVRSLFSGAAQDNVVRAPVLAARPNITSHLFLRAA